MSSLQKRLLFLVGGLLVLQTGVLLLQYLRELDASGGRFGGAGHGLIRPRGGATTPARA